MADKVIYDWGQSPTTAPSIKRSDPLGWICASALSGVVLGLLVLAMVWRPFPWLEVPPVSIKIFLGVWLDLAIHVIFPGMFREEARDYANFWARLSEGQQFAIWWRVAVAGLGALAPIFMLRKSYLTPRDSLIHLRGALRHEGEDALRLLKAKFASASKRRPDHEIAPLIPYPSDMWTRHVLVIGGTGSGKSTAMKPLIDKVVKARERMILFDPKGEFTMGFRGPAIIAPWDSRSFAWDIAKDMRNVGDMRRFAAAMIEDSQDPMWANASRQILVGFIIYMKRTRGDRWGWSELADLVSMPQANLLQIMSKYHPEAVRAVERASVTTQGILINLSSFCASIFDLAEAWGALPESKRISFVEWTLGKSRQVQIILQGHGSYTELSKSYVRGIIEVIAAIVNSVEMEDDPNRKLWIIADEFPQMGKVPIRPLFEVGRSRGVRCIVACQDLAQLEEVHGERMVKAMVSMSGTLLVGQIMQGETAEQVAKALGTREVERANMSSSYAGAGASSNRSTTLSFARDELPIYKPSELASRLGPTADGNGVVMALVTGGQAYELFWPRYVMRRERLSYMPAKWTLGVGRDAERTHSADPATDEAQKIEKTDAEATMSIEAHEDQKGSSSEANTSDVLSGVVGSNEAMADGSKARAPKPEPSEPIAIDFIGQLLRESLDVVAEVPKPSVVAEADHGHVPISEAVAEMAIDGTDIEPLSLAMKALNMASLAADTRPGPKEAVRVVQRNPAIQAVEHNGKPDRKQPMSIQPK